MVSLYEGRLPSEWDIVVERQHIEVPSDCQENIPYNKASLYPGSFNVHFTITGNKNVVHSTSNLVIII